MKSRAIVYTVGEDAVEGYTTSVAGSASDGFTITNAHVPETTTVEGAKTWAGDADDADGNRPESITVELLDGDTVAATQTVTAANDWKWSFTGVPKYRDGSEIAYSVRERAVTDYMTEVAENGRDITNTYAPETVTISGTKVWDDHDNADGVRPGSVTVRLRANGKVRDTKTVTAADDWKFSFTAPARLDGAQAVYTVSEDAVEGYTSSIEGTAADGFTITNSYAPQETQVSVFKAWNDSDDQERVRPSSVTVHLLAKDDSTGETHDTGKKLVLSADGAWQGVFSGLDKNAGGSPIHYVVSEDVPDGYLANIGEGTGDLKGSFTIVNSHRIATVDICGTKVWDDGADRDGLRPDGVRIWLCADGERIAWTEATAGASGDGAGAADTWSWSFPDFPKIRDGKEIVYTVEEEPVSGYSTEVTGSVADGFAITNVHEPAKIAVSAMKLWDDAYDNDGMRPSSVTVRLLADGVDTGKSLVLNEDNSWYGDFGELYRYDAGRLIEYTVAEDALPAELGYGAPVYEYYKDASKTFAFVTNERAYETVEIEGTKYWIDSEDAAGKRPDAVTLWLCSNGERVMSQEVGAPASGDAGDGRWPWSFGKWPRYVFGKEVVYTVEEEPVAGYSTEMTPPFVAGGDFLVANTYAPDLTYLEVAHLWVDADNQDGKRPDWLTLRLYANGESTNRTLTITKDDDWEGIFTRLNMKDANGEKIDYTVAVDPADPNSNYAYYENYKFGDTDLGYALIDVHEPELVTVQGVKTWDDADNADGIRPNKVEVTLFANGEEAGRREATSENGWTWAFEDMPRFANGEEIVYTVRESAVAGYESAVTGSVEDGFTITNTHEPEPEGNCVITYDLNGGVYEGDAGPIVESHAKGAVISIHAALTRDGYTFSYWKGSEYQPGDSYTVNGDHTFTAQWDPTPTPTPNSPPSSSPATGDSLLPLVGTLSALAATALAVCIVVQRRRRL